MTKNPRICIIGAGCSGLTTIKNLVAAGLTNVVCYEKNDQIGGNWVYTANVSHSSVAKTTFLISSKTMSQFVDFPMPEHYPDYPSHEQVLAYFQAYCEHFGLAKYIEFNTAVSHASKNDDESWTVVLENGRSRQFDYLLVASGHHAVPRHPEFREQFTGEYLHSHEFKTNAPFTDKRVLVVGAGNSGCDCAAEISRVAQHVSISIRTPQYIIPKFFMGKPVDIAGKNIEKVPPFLRNTLQNLVWRLQVGDIEQYGLERPKHALTEAHPTVNSELLYKIKHGKVQPRRGITAVNNQTITFADGSSDTFDVIVAATGYKISFPFFDKTFINYEDSEQVPLFLRIFHPEHPTLLFIGLVQPQGAVWPLSDRQAQLAARYINGSYTLPNNLAARAQADADAIASRYLNRPRHTIEVGFQAYASVLDKEINE